MNCGMKTQPSPRETDEIAERLLRDCDVGLRESRERIDASKRLLAKRTGATVVNAGLPDEGRRDADEPA